MAHIESNDPSCLPSPVDTGGSTEDAGGSAEDARAVVVDSGALKVSLLELLEAQQRETAQLFERHHLALRQAVERALPEPVAAEGTSTQPPIPSEAPSAASVGISAVPSRLASALRAPKKTEHSPTNSRSAFVKSLAESKPGSQDVSPGMWALLAREKRGTLAETATAILIILNTLLMFVQLELDGRRVSEVLQGKDPEPGTGHIVFYVCSHVFNAIFLVELVIKLAIYRGQYFRSAFDIFDFVVVVATSIDLYVLSYASTRTGNVSFLRTMRMLRLARLLRIIRMMNFFQQLRVLMHTMILSFLSIFWSMLILLLFMLVSSLLLSQLVQDIVLDESQTNFTRHWADEFYGTSSRSLYTVFEMTFSGCWPNYARNLIEVNPWFVAFFIPYVTLVVFTLIRLIYALLLKDTLQAAANDADLVVQDKMRETKSLVRKLSDLFNEADHTGDGFLVREEFEEILAYPKVQTWMTALGLDTQDTDVLFSILDDGENPDGKISRKEFVNGIMRIKGHAQKQDLLASARDTHRILHHLRDLQDQFKDLRQLPILQFGLAAAASSPLRCEGHAPSFESL